MSGPTPAGLDTGFPGWRAGCLHSPYCANYHLSGILVRYWVGVRDNLQGKALTVYGRALCCVMVLVAGGGAWAQAPDWTVSPRHQAWAYGAERHVPLSTFERIVLADARLEPAASGVVSDIAGLCGAAPVVEVDADAVATTPGGIWVGTSANLSAWTVVNGLPAPPSEEGFRLFVSEDWALVVGEGLSGAAHGLTCLRQLIAASGGSVPAVTLSDWPGATFRAVYIEGLPSEADIERWTALRLNAVICRDARLFELDDPLTAAAVTTAFEACRMRFIEPIPLLDLLTNADTLLSRNPAMAEGVTMDHAFVVSDGELVPLGTWELPLQPLANLVVSPSAPVTVSPLTGGTIYTPGQDYSSPVCAAFPFTGETVPLHALPGGQLEEGDPVRVRYTAAFPGSRDACPSEPLWQTAAVEAIETLIARLQPRSLHLGMGMPGVFASDGRCRQRNLSPDALFAETVTSLSMAAPSARVMMWADAVDAYGLWDAVPALPGDMTLCPRFAGSALVTMARFGETGHSFAVTCHDTDCAAWDDPQAATAGATAFIYHPAEPASPGDTWAALPRFAAAVWQVSAPDTPPSIDPPPFPDSDDAEVPLTGTAWAITAFACALLALRSLRTAR